METIYKFPIKVEDIQHIEIPADAEILCVQTQREIPCLWVRLNPSKVNIRRTIFTHGTGHAVAKGSRYVGTYQLQGGMLVFHVFERQLL